RPSPFQRHCGSSSASLLGSVRHAGFPLLWLPGFVIAGRRRAMTATHQRARRPIGVGRAGQIRLMRLLPGIFRLATIRRDLVDRMMQPTMPFRRHARAFGLAFIKHPALLAAEAAAAALELPLGLVAVVAIAERIRADLLAAE